MGYKYSIWVIPNNWKYIQSYYKTEHTPHVTIKTLLTISEAFSEINKYKSHYMINYNANVYDFNNISYTEDKDADLPASGFLCDLQDLKLEHQAHMTLYYHYHNTEITMEPPTNTLGKVYIVNTVSDDPKKWYILH